MVDSRVREYFQKIFDAAARVLDKTGATPDGLTVAALIIGLCAAAALIPGWFILSLVLLWVSGLMDVLDGSLARIKGSSTPAGAFMDLIFDRVVEAAFIITFAIVRPEVNTAALIFLGGVIFNFSTFLLAGKLFENTGVKSMHYDDGLVERTETFIAFSLMLLLPGFPALVLWVFNALMLTTGVIRFAKILKLSRQMEEKSKEEKK